MKRIVFIIACACLLACKTSKESINIEQQGTTQATHKEETNNIKFSSFQFSIDSIVIEAIRKQINMVAYVDTADTIKQQTKQENIIVPRTKIYGIRAAKKDTVFLLKQVTDTIVKEKLITAKQDTKTKDYFPWKLVVLLVIILLLVLGIWTATIVIQRIINKV